MAVIVTVPGFDQLVNLLNNLPNTLFQFFLSSVISGLTTGLQSLVDMSFHFLFSAPNQSWFCAQYGIVMSVLESLYAIALMGLALMFILRSNDVEGRIASKKWLESLIVMVILLSFSYSLFGLLLDFNTGLSTSFASDSMKQLFTPPSSLASAIFSLIILLFITILLLLTFVTLLVRYLLIPFLLLLFPIAIFLYFVPFTQSLGKSVLRATAIIVFMSSIDALILLGLSSLFNANDPNLADSLVKAFAVLFGFGTIGLINVLLILSAILSVVSQSKALSSVVGVTVLSKVLPKR